MTDKEKIRKEIERKIEICEKYSHLNLTESTSIGNHAQLLELRELKVFIDSLPEENHSEDNSEMVSEDLEEAANQHSKQVFHGLLVEDNITAFKAGAEWRGKKDQETIELAEDHAMLAGMNKMKEEMMKNAVEGTVKYEIGSAEISQCDRRYQVLSDPTPIANAKLGDKVKIIIVKTEQQ